MEPIGANVRKATTEDFRIYIPQNTDFGAKTLVMKLLSIIQKTSYISIKLLKNINYYKVHTPFRSYIENVLDYIAFTIDYLNQLL